MSARIAILRGIRQCAADILAGCFKIPVIKGCDSQLGESSILPFRISEIVGQCCDLLPVLAHDSRIEFPVNVAFPNSAAVGLPLLAAVYGAKSLDTVATSIALGSVTVSAITLAILEAGRDKSGKGFSSRQIALSLLRSVKKPIVWAPLVGLAFSCAGLHLPSYMDASLAVLGSAASGSALVLTGLVVSSQKFEFGENTLFTVFLKNALQPGLALGIAMLLHLSLSQTRYVTLISAIPCGFFGLVFGKGFDSSPKLASSGLIASYVIGVATLALWIVILNHIG